MDDLATFGKPLRRSKEAVLRRLEAELGSETIADLTRDRLIQYGRDRVKAGAGPATLAILSRIVSCRYSPHWCVG